MISATGGVLCAAGKLEGRPLHFVEYAWCDVRTHLWLHTITISPYHAPSRHRIQGKPACHENKVGAGGVLRRCQYRSRQPARRALLPIRLDILQLGEARSANDGKGAVS